MLVIMHVAGHALNGSEAVLLQSPLYSCQPDRDDAKEHHDGADGLLQAILRSVWSVSKLLVLE